MDDSRAPRLERQRRGCVVRIAPPEGDRLTSGRFNVELKARCARLAEVREVLLRAGADPRGTDLQTDTYFQVPRGRLKVREGAIENALIAYERPDTPGAKPCDVTMTELDADASAALRELLEAALPVRVRVRKRREILFIGNVKFHLDEVDGLGAFVEIEAQGRGGEPPRAVLEAQAAEWRARLAIEDADLEPRSYSDLLAGTA